jgi:hypothetical protein
MATTYSIENILEGTYYRSHSLKRRGLEGIITYAEKSDVWFGNDYQAYLVTVRPTYRGYPHLPAKDYYATVAVKVSE